ncbi:hypothetical protein JCM8097_001739 [Rhodosporidiobolus ruineniae]
MDSLGSEDDYGYDAYDGSVGTYWSAKPKVQPYAGGMRPVGAGVFGDRFVAPELLNKGKQKGKGKSKVSGSQDDASLDPATKLSQADLARLEDLPPNELASILERDDTPVDDLVPSLKLVKAVQLITNRMATAAPSAGAFLDGRECAKLLELLSSAMRDSQRIPQTIPPRLSDIPGFKEADEILTRKRLGLAPRPAETSAVSSAEPGSAQPQEATAATGAPAMQPPQPDRYPGNVPDLVSLFEENVKLALAALRPSSIFDSPDETLAPELEEDEKDETQEDELVKAQEPTGPCFINKLPAEILTAIFELAREGSVKHVVPREEDFRSFIKTLDDNGLVPEPLHGSKPAALRFALALSFLCKQWTQPARTVAYRKLTIHHGLGLVKLNAYLANSGGSGPSIASQIKSLDVVVAAAHPEDDGDDLDFNMAPRPGNGGWRRYGASPRRSKGAPKPEDKEERNAGLQFAKLVAATTKLRSLTLKVVDTDGYIDEAGQYADFLEPTIFRALTTTPTLRHLHLRHVTDFEELEQIVKACPDLESLKLESLDNLSGGAAQLSSISPHPASKLRVVHIGNPRFADRSSLSSAQLVWLLEPAVTSNSLRDLQVVLVASGNGANGVGGGINNALAAAGGMFGLGGGGAGGLQGPVPPFASADFADLLARCGTSLERLVLQDLSYSGAVDQSLLQAPHNGSLDHSLASLSRLSSLSLQWTSTGSSFLPSISPLTSLHSLSLHGIPEETSAPAFADALQAAFPALKAVTFSGGIGLVGGAAMGIGGRAGGVAGALGGGGGANAWTGAGIRKIREVGEARGIKVVFDRSGG